MEEIRVISVNGLDIKVGTDDYLCISDFAGDTESSKELINSWIRNKNTIEFLGIWETINNPNFKGVEFDTFKNEAGTNRFRLSPRKWATTTGAIGIQSKSGKYNSGTYAHMDIALEFASWLNPAFKLYIIKEFQRLKKEEASQGNEEWDLARMLSKINYTIHTDAVKNHIIRPMGVEKDKEWLVYASEGDILNYALFSKTAKQWRNEHPESAKKNNIRDFATKDQLVVLNNLESSNATMIREGLTKEQRLAKLTIQAKEELESLGKIAHKIPSRTKAPLFYQPPKLKTTAQEMLNKSNIANTKESYAVGEEEIKEIALSPKPKK